MFPTTTQNLSCNSHLGMQSCLTNIDRTINLHCILCPHRLQWVEQGYTANFFVSFCSISLMVVNRMHWDSATRREPSDSIQLVSWTNISVRRKTIESNCTNGGVCSEVVCTFYFLLLIRVFKRLQTLILCWLLTALYCFFPNDSESPISFILDQKRGKLVRHWEHIIISCRN